MVGANPTLEAERVSNEKGGKSIIIIIKKWEWAKGSRFARFATGPGETEGLVALRAPKAGNKVMDAEVPGAALSDAAAGTRLGSQL